MAYTYVKPRIWKNGRRWFCQRDDYRLYLDSWYSWRWRGEGATPAEAYRAWQWA